MAAERSPRPNHKPTRCGQEGKPRNAGTSWALVGADDVVEECNLWPEEHSEYRAALCRNDPDPLELQAVEIPDSKVTVSAPLLPEHVCAKGSRSAGTAT